MTKPSSSTSNREHSRQQNRGVTVERVLAAAEELFLEKGFRATSVVDIAAAAGYTTGAIYYSFSGKDDLFLAVYRRRAKQQEDVLRAALAAATTPEETVQAIGLALTTARLEPPWYAVVFEFLSYAARDEQLSREAADVFRGGQALFAEALRDVASRSALGLERLATIVAALLRGLALTWFIDPASVDDSLFADALDDLILASRRGDSETPAAHVKKATPRESKAAAGTSRRVQKT